MTIKTETNPSDNSPLGAADKEPATESVRDTIYSALEDSGNADLVEKHQVKSRIIGRNGADDAQPEPKSPKTKKDKLAEPDKVQPDDDDEQAEDLEAAEPEDSEQEPDAQDKPSERIQSDKDNSSSDDLPTPSWLRTSEAPDPEFDKEWATVPQNIKTRAMKREMELQEGYRRYAQKAQEYDQWEAFIGPRRQKLAELGATPQQMISVALHYNDHLFHPSKEVRDATFERLARNFGYDLRRLGPIQPLSPQEKQQLEHNAYQYHAGLHQAAQQSQQQQAARAKLAGERSAAWSKGKSHISPRVTTLIHSFLQSGEVSISDDLKDLEKALDKAYKMAIKALDLGEKPKPKAKPNNSKAPDKDISSVRRSIKNAMKQLSVSNQR